MEQSVRRNGNTGRTGSAAVEFAMVLVPLMAILGGTIDYGWFFLQQATVAEAVRDAARAGSYGTPDENETSGCAECVSTARAVAQDGLAAAGFTVAAADIVVTIEPVGTSCAIVVAPVVTHDSLMGLVPLPDHYNVRVTAFAQSIAAC